MEKEKERGIIINMPFKTVQEYAKHLIHENFANCDFPKETEEEIEMLSVRNDILFTNLHRFIR